MNLSKNCDHLVEWQGGRAQCVRPPPLAGEGGEGEATGTEQAASPSPALQPKSDLSDFSPLSVPNSGRPDFG
jgi:hypothetical protein